MVPRTRSKTRFECGPDGAEARVHDVAVPGGVDHPDRDVAEGLLVELVGGDQAHRQVEALVGDPGADVLDPAALGVAGVGAADDQVDPLGDHGVADLVERPEPAQAPVLGRALGADPADDVVGADVRRPRARRRSRRRTRASRSPRPGPAARRRAAALIQAPSADHQPGAEHDRLVLGERIRLARRRARSARRRRRRRSEPRGRAGPGSPASGAAAAASARSPGWRSARRRTRSAPRRARPCASRRSARRRATGASRRANRSIIRCASSARRPGGDCRGAAALSSAEVIGSGLRRVLTRLVRRPLAPEHEPGEQRARRRPPRAAATSRPVNGRPLGSLAAEPAAPLAARAAAGAALRDEVEAR